jgi:hypothetical protein
MKNKTDNKEEEKFITMDMPEVKDIPGQENIKPPRMREMEDVTISSDDEEGVGILDDLNNEENVGNGETNDSNVTTTEKELLSHADRPVDDEQKDIDKIALDDIDEEETGASNKKNLDLGEDLDVPGSELDDEDEMIGEEDEENNNYSRPD